MHLQQQLSTTMLASPEGRVVQTVGATIAAGGFAAPLGAMAEIHRAAAAPLEAEVIGFRDHLTLLSPLDALSGVRRGDRVRLRRTNRTLRVGDALLGRVVGAW